MVNGLNDGCQENITGRHMDVKGIARQLHEIINTGKCVVWVGSGLSKVAGFKDWSETVKDLCHCCGEPPTKVQHPSANKLIKIADQCKCADETAYCNTLARLFGQRVVVTRQAYHLLMKLPFRHYVTTNVDPLLASAAVLHHDVDLACYPNIWADQLGSDRRCTFYLHGLARKKAGPTGKNLVFSKKEFDDAYKNDSPLRSFLCTLLAKYPILFVGCSLSENAIQTMFARVEEIQMELSERLGVPDWPPRYALISSSESSEFIQRMKKTNIVPLMYKETDRHPEIEEILEEVCLLQDISIWPQDEVRIWG